MKRFTKYVSVIALIFCVVGIAHAQNVRATFGGRNTAKAYAITEKTDNIVYFRPTGGVKLSYESVTTSDTITAEETGRTYVYSGTINSEFELPAAVVGMSYRFVSTSATSTMSIDPNGTDRIHFGTAGLELGDRLISPGATQDSIEIFCAVAGEWSIANINGTWTDGGS